MSTRSNIIIIGFTSSGKTSTGLALGKTLDFPVVDLDALIEDLYAKQFQANKTVRQIYQEEGKKTFRKYEADALASLRTIENSILATGGGVARSKRNRDILKELGTVVYLRSSPGIVYERMMIAKGIPAYLADDPSLERLEEAWTMRDPVYARMADIVVDNSLITPSEVANRIVAQLPNRVIK